MIVYDDLEPSEKVKVYDKGITDGRREGGCLPATDWIPDRRYVGPDVASDAEALEVEAEHFARSVTGGERSPSDGHAGLRVVQILEAATRSLQGARAASKTGMEGQGGIVG